MKSKFLIKYIRLLTFCFLVAAVSLQAQQPTGIKSDSTINLFVIGNSFSINATKYLAQLAQEGGKNLIIGKAEIGGSALQKHWELVEAYEKDTSDNAGKPYRGKSLRMLLSEGRCDIVTFQQVSITSADVESYRPYAQKLYEYIRKIQPDAEVVFHQTWAYRMDAKSFSRINENRSAHTARKMYKKSRMAYHTIAKELNIRIIPVGDAFYSMGKIPGYRYVKDKDFNFNDPLYPELPDQSYSLHTGYRWGPDKVFGGDFNHANDAGCFLGSLVWYSFLFGESPVNLKFKPENMDEDFANQLRKTAGKTVLLNSKKSNYK